MPTHARDSRHTILPSVSLSGDIFQISNTPAFFRGVIATILAT